MENDSKPTVLDDELVLRDYRTALAKNNLLYIPSFIRKKLDVGRFQRFSVSLRVEDGEYALVLKKVPGGPPA